MFRKHFFRDCFSMMILLMWLGFHEVLNNANKKSYPLMDSSLALSGTLYSYFMASTGFAWVAFHASPPTVITAIIRATMLATTKGKSV